MEWHELATVVLAVISGITLVSGIRLRFTAQFAKQEVVAQMQNDIEELKSELRSARELTIRNGEQISALTLQINRLVMTSEEVTAHVAELTGQVRILVSIQTSGRQSRSKEA